MNHVLLASALALLGCVFIGLAIAEEAEESEAATYYYLKVTYDANGGSGAPTDNTVYSDTDRYIDYKISTTKPTRSGYTFLGWDTWDNRVYASYLSGTTYEFYSSSTSSSSPAVKKLYAIWTPVTMTIILKSHDGSSTYKTLTGTFKNTYNTTYKVYLKNLNYAPDIEGYKFLGWTPFINSSSKTVYPTWELNTTVATSFFAVYEPLVTSIDLVGPETLEPDGTATITATVSPSDADQSVTWASSDTVIVTVEGDGLNATVTAVAEGTATITATANDGSGVVGSLEITVKAPGGETVNMLVMAIPTILIIGLIAMAAAIIVRKE